MDQKNNGNLLVLNATMILPDKTVLGDLRTENGTISEIKPESNKLTVLVSLFERETPVELGFEQVGPLA